MSMQRTKRGLWVLWAMTLFASGGEAAPGVLTFSEGRVMLRPAEQHRVEFPKTGRELAEGEALITGDQARLEVKTEAGGLWRLGRRAVFVVKADGGSLLAGTALVRVPSEAGWRVEGARGAVLLGKGLWMVQAVDNEGLKLMCLDGPAWAEAGGDDTSSGKLNTPPVRVGLRPGELVFLRPGGVEFGPIVTIYLEELLATSRLVNAFPERLPEARRLLNLGLAQRERLKGVSNALVGGARDEKGFEIAVPKQK